MNKNALIGRVAERTGLTRAEAGRAVEAALDIIAEALREGTEIRLVGFGTFLVTERAASRGRNPRTGEPIDNPASRQAKFRAGKTLKDSLNP